MKSHLFARKPAVLALSFVFVGAPVWAQEVAEPVTVEVSAPRLNPDAVLEGRALDLKRAANPDTASLLTSIPGVNVNGVGALANMPVIRGMADDRLTIKVDGIDAISACSNHMNTPLSYVAPTSVEDIKVYKSLAPVSVGSNSIGGAIVVNTARPEFAEDAQPRLSGQLGGFYYSNGDGNGGNVSATAANDRVSVNYTGSTSKANNYTAGGNFNNWGPTASTFNGGLGSSTQLPNNVVGSTAYLTTNQAASIATKLTEKHTVQFQYTSQSTPLEGFANQPMDMLGNEQYRLNLRYWGKYDWGKLEAQTYKENVNHTMNFGPDKKYWYASGATGMPMNTNSTTLGAKVKADYELAGMSLLRSGLEYQHYYLNDWWPVSGTGGMSPNAFQNINGGVQQTSSLYTEWEKRYSSEFKSLLGARYSLVNASTGNVQGYNTSATYAADAAAFNAAGKTRNFNNVDLNATGFWEISQQQSATVGMGRQVRAPNLYQLYTWSTGGMAANMNSALGDGNGYFGNVNLNSETAYTVSGEYDLHSENRAWQTKFAPYYSYVYDYIDAIQWSGNSVAGAASTTLVSSQWSLLRYVNQNAQLAGADLSGRMPLGKNDYGVFGLNGFLSYTWGRNQQTGYGLYNIMPLNGKLTFTHHTTGWDNALELVAVARKSRTSVERNEVQTPGYFISNIRGSYSWQKVRIDAGINNIFNTLYYNPLGGSYYGQGATMTGNYNRTQTAAAGGPVWGVAMPMPGMSIYTALNVKF